MTSTPWDRKSPELRRAIICYADILGFRARTEQKFRMGQGTEFLLEIKRSLGAAYDRIRQAQTLGGVVPSIFDMKLFTDNIVVAYPVREPDAELGEIELGSTLMLFGQVQASLAADGFLLRGAITYGDHYQDDDIAYGLALLEAVDLDKSGAAPRLAISQSAEDLITQQLTSYADVTVAPHYSHLLRDPSEGRLFVNYLEVIFENFLESGIDYDLLKVHRDNVSKGLQKYESIASVKEKYEWLATYHNYVCREFAEQWHSVLSHPEASPEDMDFAEEAQGALDFLVPFDGLPPPQRLDPKDFNDPTSHGPLSSE